MPSRKRKIYELHRENAKIAKTRKTGSYAFFFSSFRTIENLRIYFICSVFTVESLG